MTSSHTLAWIAAACLATGAQADPTIHADLAYSDMSSRNVLDIYLPEDRRNPPLVLYVHGGGWLHNTRQDVRSQRVGLDRLLDAGFAVASMEYRLAPSPDYPETDPTARATWPAQLEDVGAALDFLRGGGAEHGYDAGRIAIFGESAGGQIVLASGLTFAASPDRAVDAVVAWYPATDLARIDADRAEMGLPAANLGPLAPESLLVGADVRTAPAAAAAASPVHMLGEVQDDTDLPPILLMHGDEDEILPYTQSVRFAEAAQEMGRGVDLILVSGGTHAGGAFDTDPAVLDAVIAFLGDAFDAATRAPDARP